MFSLIFISAAALFPLTARELLVQVYVPAEKSPTVFNSNRWTVVAELENCLLVRTETDELEQLRLRADSLVTLDLPREKELYYVHIRSGFDRATLSQLGTVVGTTPNGVLLAIDPPSLLELNRLPVELCRLTLEPLNLYPEPSPPVPVPVSESLVSELVSRVNPDSVLAHIRRLQEFHTRYSTTESCRAAVEWLRDRLISYGCDSTALETYRSNYAPNVIGVKRGKLNPNPIYVICGHIDNTSDSAPERCPGSDDNASGTAAVLEAARVFQDVDFAYSVYFIGFTGEEQGLFGSDSFCRRAARRGDSIRAALNFDMISYGRQNLDSFEVIGKIANPSCAWLVDSFIASARTYTALKPVRRLVNSAPYSDHHSFWQRGYPALCGIEHDFTPEYHTIGDTIGPLYFTDCGTNNWLMATEAIRAAVATIARLAGAQIQTGIAQSGILRPVVPVRQIIGKPPFHLQSGTASPNSRWRIYDARGRMVALVNAPVWNGADHAGRTTSPGVYFARPEKPNPLAVRLVVCP
jgi:hypothetical protein